MSRLEGQFELLWRVVNGPPLVKEYRFIPKRRYRADFAHLASKTLIELDGGIFSRTGGGHNRGAAYCKDRERDLEAWLVGWTTVRLTEKQLKWDEIKRIAERLET